MIKPVIEIIQCRLNFFRKILLHIANRFVI